MKDRYYWIPVPGIDPEEPLPGKLIVVEGTDCVGRSTQTRMLRNWLESSGLAVYDTGLRRGSLAGRDILRAKEGHTMGRRTQCLFYASDFADRLVNEIVPSLRAGYIVLTDRYIYSLMARAIVRGLDRDWLEKMYGFALKPDLVLYLTISIDELLPRVLASGGFDYWESGMDFFNEDTMYNSFIKYQNALLTEFNRMADKYGFTRIDATPSIMQVHKELRTHVEKIVGDMVPGMALLTGFAAQPGGEPIHEDVEESRGSVADRLRDLLYSFLEDN